MIDKQLLNTMEGAGEYETLLNQEASLDLDTTTIGRILSVKDGVAFVSGLDSIKVGEMVEFIGNQTFGMALNLEKEYVGTIIFGDDSSIKQGDEVKALGRLVQVSTGEKYLGHVLDGLGQIIDDSPIIEAEVDLKNIERKAPGVITRLSVTEPLLTGYKVIDSMLPIGRGQRELIVGDRQTGKSTIAIDAILNQRFTNAESTEVYCVYVGIGQKQSTIYALRELLSNQNALHFTTLVAATASQSASLQFIAPYTGCSIAEYFRDNGQHALIVYDDLTKHAAAYRQLSLLLRRPPGREAFPGDVFYAHARLLERACKLNHTFGGGSLTALPIVETQAGDLSGYIPTNVISITDGQIFMEKDLFFKGIRPAVNVGSSVSRVGSKAQPHALKLVTGSLRYELAQYREYSVFAQFASDLDEVTKAVLRKGSLLTEALTQKPHAPLELYKQVLILLAASTGRILHFIRDIKRDLPVIRQYEESLYKALDEQSIRELYWPLFSQLELANKEDFAKVKELPLFTFVLRFMENKFEKEVGR